MSRIIAVVGILLSFSRVYADQSVLSDDGREVRLLKDGTWEYVSNDRFATSEDGKRIRLQADGRWVEIKDDRNWIAVPAQALLHSRDVASEGGFDVELSEIRIESIRTKKKKNSRLRSQMVATLKISSATDSSLALDASAFSLSDSRGRSYPLVALAPGNLSLTPGVTDTVTIIVDGSPRWWGIKFLRLQIAAGILGQAGVELTKSMSEITKLEVEALTKQRP